MNEWVNFKVDGTDYGDTPVVWEDDCLLFADASYDVAEDFGPEFHSDMFVRAKIGSAWVHYGKFTAPARTPNRELLAHIHAGD